MDLNYKESTQDNEEYDSLDDEEEEMYENGHNEKQHQVIITKEQIKEWSELLHESERPFGIINEITKAFRGALNSILPGSASSKGEYRVEGSDMFNNVIRLCMKEMIPQVMSILELPVQTSNDHQLVAIKMVLPNRGKYWKKLKVPMKTYISDIIELIKNIHEATILNALLRHARLLISFYMCYPKLLRSLTKLLIQIWSQNDEKSRVIAFVCMHKIASNTHELNVDFIYRTLYLSFVRNSKFTSPNTLPVINFMQHSLVELFKLNKELAYKHAFVYIRHLAMSLRNAINLKTKEAYQQVYNWQFVHSLNLWSKLCVSASATSDEIRQLIYPLAQTISGTIRLVPTPRYYPLRFHCVNMLITIANVTNVFVPVVPFLMEIFDSTDFNKKHATINPKELNFSIILKLAKAQLLDKSFKDALIDNIYDSLVTYLQGQSHDISFPELCFPLILRLKDFLKKCKNSNYCKVIKGLLDKLQENCKFIEDKRKNINFSLKNRKSIDEWSLSIRENGTPLMQWFSRYKLARERELMLAIAQKDVIVKNQVPKIERPTSQMKESDKREFGKLFGDLDGDENDDDGSELDFVPKKKLKKNSDEEQYESDDASDEFNEQQQESGDDDAHEEMNTE